MKKHTPAWVPQAHRSVADLIESIAVLPTPQEKVKAILASPKAVKEILRFCYCGIPLDLPQGPMNYVSVNPEAMPHPPRRRVMEPMVDEDMISREAHSLLRKFGVGMHTLTSARRLEIWKDICERCDPQELRLLELIRTTRTIRGIPREVVVSAGLLDTAPRVDAPVQGIEYPPSLFEALDSPRVVASPTPPASPSHEPSASDLLYREAMSRMRFWS